MFLQRTTSDEPAKLADPLPDTAPGIGPATDGSVVPGDQELPDSVAANLAVSNLERAKRARRNGVRSRAAHAHGQGPVLMERRAVLAHRTQRPSAVA